jgi:hypothetical protein
MYMFHACKVIFINQFFPFSNFRCGNDAAFYKSFGLLSLKLKSGKLAATLLFLLSALAHFTNITLMWHQVKLLIVNNVANGGK